jgi:uncharacterized surface protein with fasciclin (FAS1) repeats
MQDKFLWPAAIVLCLAMACNHESKNQTERQSSKTSTPLVATSQQQVANTIADHLAIDTSHSDLTEAFTLAGLMETLQQPGPFTVFAPTNDAFRRLPPGTFEGLMKKRINDFANILSYHIVAGLIKSKDMKDGEKLKTLAGEELIVTRRKEKVLINGIHVINPAVDAGNGIVYVIDGVLFPRGHNPGAY